MKNKLENLMRNPRKLIVYILDKEIFKFIPDEIFLKLKYWGALGEKLNLNNPKKFNEKIQWLKINDRKKEYIDLVDKYKVRKYIENKLGNEFLIPLIGVYDKFDEIDFEKLPKKFVLKANHTSGDVYLCKNKDDINKAELKKTIDKWIKRQYYWIHREWPYKDVKPKIVCEEYMVDETGYDLKDYKFMCFNGKVECLFVCSDRNSNETLKIDFYDRNWTKMDLKKSGIENSEKILKKPKNFELMIKLAEDLAKNIPFVRIDFYDIKGQVYFGEITFYPDAGFKNLIPNKYNTIFGELINL